MVVIGLSGWWSKTYIKLSCLRFQIKKLYFKINKIVECMFVAYIGTQQLLNRFWENFKLFLEIILSWKFRN